MFHGVSVAGYHLHFLADSCNFGGHILGFTGFSGKVEIGQVDALEQNFPTKSQKFLQAKFNLDQLKKILNKRNKKTAEMQFLCEQLLFLRINY